MNGQELVKQVSVLMLTSLVLLTGAGCGDSDRATLYRVSGTLTVNGRPAPGVYMELLPVTDDQPPRIDARRAPAYAETDEQGHFRIFHGYKNVEGAEPGKYRLAFSAEGLRRGVPSRYHVPEGEFTDYEVIVTTDGQTLEIDLSPN